MREILFRGKRLNDGKWVYGSLIQMDNVGSQSFIFPFYKYASSLTCDQIVSMFMVVVDPATVGQFTGLYDKNGKKIFEGDVVGCWDIYHENYAKGEVIKKITGEWLFYPYLQHGRFWALFSNDIGECPVEVIGNIHDNPELLEEVEE